MVSRNQRGFAERYLNISAFDQWGPEMAYALGLFYADGCLIQQPRGSLKVQMYNTDQATVEWWHGFLWNQTKITVQPRKPPHKTLYSSTATSDTLGSRLIALGAGPRKSWADMHIPEMPLECLPHFMRGVNDGDGGVYIGRSRKSKGGKILRVGITSNSDTFREDLCRLFTRQGWSHQNYHITVRLSGSNAEQFCQWIYRESGPHMVRKKTVWEKWKSFRQEFGGLISEVDPYETLRGIRPQEWHTLVGTLPDKEVAKVTGVTSGQVFNVRKALGISPCVVSRSTSPRPWHGLVGTMLDVEVAKIGGISPASVCMYRQKVGLPCFQPPTPTWHSQVGSIPDSKLAGLAGVSRKTILRHRKQYGLPVYKRGA